MTVYTIQTDGLEYLEDTLSRGRQTWRRQTTARWQGHKLRAVVERDSYDFQSRLYVDVFSARDLKWNRLQTLEGSEYGHLPSAYTANDDEGNARIRRETEDVVVGMIAYAQQILEGVPA